MGLSKIEWTDYTFNPWWGCVKVSAACKFCYAETVDKRWDGDHWGPNSQRTRWVTNRGGYNFGLFKQEIND